jgi:putative transcriptional regulator
VKNRLTEIREKQGKSIIELAELCSVTRQAIYAIENGQHNPSVLLALKLARILQVKVEDLFVMEKSDL